jgi:predicted amidohydrolase
MMKIRAAQFAVRRDAEENLAYIRQEVQRAKADGVRLIVFPEGIIARDPKVDSWAADHAEDLTGPFITALREYSESGVAIAGTFHIRAEDDKVLNVALVFDHGEIVHRYDKVHLYDAFHSKESDRVTPGTQAPDVFTIDGTSLGMITCYDVRFPEISRDLALKGAEAILVPAAWVKGLLKEHHWQTMLTARALENTVYVVGCGESGDRNIGMSMIIDPLGSILATAVERDSAIDAEVSSDRIEAVRANLPVLANMKYKAPELA